MKTDKRGISQNKIVVWDKTGNKCIEVLEEIQYRFEIRKYKFFQYENKYEYKKYENFTQKKLPAYLDEIADCDYIISFGDSDLTYISAAMGKPVLTFEGIHGAKTTIGCFPHIKGWCNLNYTTDLVISAIDTMIADNDEGR